MIDINLIRENPGLIKKNLEKRNKNDKIKLFNELISLDKKYRKFLSRCKITHVEGLFTYYKNNSKEVL